MVTVNYRLGALGFFHLADLGSRWAGCTNLALQDQIAALRWVRDNIAAFGGDPGNVTVAGQSAGAFSIGALLAMPAADGLFHKAILQSGRTSRLFGRATATTMAEDLLTAVGLDDAEGLLTVPVQRILDLQSTVVTGDIGHRNLPGGRSWGAVLDGSVLPVAPQQAVTQGAAAAIPLLIGATRDEVRVFQMIGGDSFRPADETALYTEMRRAEITELDKLLAAYHGVSVLLQEWAGLLNGCGDRSSVLGEQFAEDGLGADFAQVENGGQDAVGVGELGAGARAGPGGALPRAG